LDVLNQTNIKVLYYFPSGLKDKPTIRITNPKRFTSSAIEGITFNSNDGLVTIHFDADEFAKNGTVLNKNGIVEYTLYFMDNKAHRIVVVAKENR
jgi:hypothetical protein